MRTETFKVEGQKSLFNQINLDFERTKRIYRVLGDLSQDSMDQLKAGELTQFSFSSDKMRPMLSYIADNQITLSKHLEQDSEYYKFEEELRQLSQKLKRNLNSVEVAMKTMSAVDFNPVFFLSEELTNAYIDYQLPMAWEFEHDLVTINNLEHTLLLDLLIKRGQKRIFLIGGNINVSDLKIEYPDVIVYKTEDHKSLDELVVAFPQRPPRRITSLDCGNKPSSVELMNEIKDLLSKGRSRAWLRFNTINRGDAVKILDNLSNIHIHRQTSDFHQKFKGKAAVIVCPGPSLSKNIDYLKEIKGKALIICVLHALRPLRKAGIIPDIVIHTDPQNLKALSRIENELEVSLYDHWINAEELEGVSYFVTSSSGSPDNFDFPVKEVIWMSPGMRIGAFLPIDLFDYTRVGGSVSHSAFDLAIEFGFSKIALVGQDLALSETGELYANNAELDLSPNRMANLGEEFKTKGFYGNEVTTNASFSFFAQFYKHFAKQVNAETNIKLFNCTEGGVYLEGFDHISLKKFIKDEVVNTEQDRSINSIFASVIRDEKKYLKEKAKLIRFIKDNIKLGKEVKRLSKIAIGIAKKKYQSEEDLSRFDLVQNKTIKKLTKNYFYTLGLQKEIYILKAGVAADNSTRGQIGFHLDFLRSVVTFNTKFLAAFTKQLALISIKA
ncbi:MAG: hypothetical protein CME52_05695 [Halieaceae bacterium]|nr:hypothetical protein [Halieaceae bacterium]RPG89998.1 MAG: DUF115 domain-containing protein [Cellvibrionales bacterium TMED157]